MEESKAKDIRGMAPGIVERIPHNEIIIHGRVEKVIWLKNGYYYIYLATISRKKPITIRVSYQSDGPLSLKPKSRVIANGCIINYIIQSEGTKKVSQSIKVFAIEPEITYTENIFHVPGKFLRSLGMTINTAGTVTGCWREHDWFHYFIKTKNPHSGQTVTIHETLRLLDRHPDIRKGDFLYTICGYAVAAKEGKNYQYEDIMIDDVAVISPEGRRVTQTIKKAENFPETDNHKTTPAALQCIDGIPLSLCPDIMDDAICF